jgi:3'-5' exoribonuclease
LEGEIMAKKFVSEYKTGDPVDEVFLVQRKEMKTARNGAMYIHADVGDKSGSLPARMWDATQLVFESFDVDDFVRIRGKIESYQNTLQLNIRTVTKADAASANMADFLPQTEKDVDEMLAGLRQVTAQVKDPNVAALLNAFFADEGFVKGFKWAPAATSYHHAFLGGLLEHTWSIVGLAQKVLDHYPSLRRDLLLAGCILHDIGKTRELGFRRAFQYTDEGGLLGHLVIGTMMVQEKADALKDFPREILMAIQHMILSHHGSREFGSPVLPATPEAIALHHLDNLDAKVNEFTRAIEEDLNKDSNWTEWSRMFERKLYKK